MTARDRDATAGTVPDARTGGAGMGGVGGRWLRRLAALRARPSDPRTERIALLVAAAVFVGAGLLSWRELRNNGVTLAVWPIVAIALIGTPLTVVTNAAEFLITARVLGQRSRPAVAIRVALLSIAANLLPVPGSLLVRARALTSSGASYRDAASTSLMIGVAWLSMTSIVAGACLIALMPVVVGSSVILGGLAGFVWVARFVARRAEDVGKTVVLVAVVELMAVFAAALRFWLALRAMSVGAGIAQAVVLSSSGVLSSLAGVFPGGMGLRELLSGALGAAVDLPSARGVATSVVDRLVLVAMLSPVALGLARSRS